MTLTVEQQRIVEGKPGACKSSAFALREQPPVPTGIYSYDDLFQIGCIALCEAVIEYNPGAPCFRPMPLQQYATDLQCACTRHILPQKGETQSDFPNEPVAVVPMDTPEAHELRKVLREAQDRLKGVTRKGIDAMIFMSEGFTCREIGEMYGTNANNVTAWISKARKALRLDVKFMRFAAELEV